MKLGITVAGEHALPSAFTVLRGFEHAIGVASELGYGGVELALKSAGEINKDELRVWLEKGSIEVAAISTGQVYADSGLYFSSSERFVREQAISVFKDLILLAEEFGHRVNIGRIRGSVAQYQETARIEKRLIRIIQDLCDYAAERNVEILIEPVNRYETNLINTLDEGTAFLEKIGRGNCGLMPDIFHMNIEEANIEESLIRNRKWIKYIHLADSNRHAPGKGHLDFQKILKTLKDIEYDGWVTIEILPFPSEIKAAQDAVSVLESYL